MSIKIFNGYKFNQYMSLEELSEFVSELRIGIKKKAISFAEEEVAKLAVNMIDYNKILGMEKLKSYYGGITISDEFNPFYNSWLLLDNFYYFNKKIDLYTVNTVFFPIEKKLLVLFYSNHRYFSVFNKTKMVSEYCYFNNTDKPENISSKEWIQREKDWEKALPYGEAPSDCGLAAKILDGFPLLADMDTTKFSQYVPNMESRIERMAKTILQEKHEKSGNLLVYDKWMKTEEYKKEYEKQKEIIGQKLNQNIKLNNWE